MRSKRFFLLIVLVVGLLLHYSAAEAQCSICTRTAQQMGEKPARGLNEGIIYLAFTPLVLIGFVGYRWWKKNNQNQ